MKIRNYRKVRNLTLFANLMLIIAMIPFVLSYNFLVFNPVIAVYLYGGFTLFAICLKFYSQVIKRKEILRSI